MMFKVPDEIEDGNVENWKQFYSSEYGYTESMIPFLAITYQNHNGLEDYWSYSSASAGRAGTGYVNLFTGNLTWVRGDLGFGGNRMPVSISHVYNSNDSQRNDFGMGFGWRSNYHQTITASGGIYVWEDGDGTRHAFYQAKDSAGTAIANTYVDEDGLHLTLTTGGSGNQTYTLTDQMGNKSYFDAAGRLCKIENNQQTKSNISITYTTTTSKLIGSITDGVGRVYQFHYQLEGLLSRISYIGSGNTELTYVTYLYLDGNLIRATDKDGNFTAYAYTEHLLSKSQDVSRNPVDDGYYLDIEYYVAYTYEEISAGNSVMPVKEAEEYKSMGLDDSLSSYYQYNYYAHYTNVKDIEDKITNYQFNDFGNLVAAYNSDGHVQYTKYAINDVRELQNNLMAPTAELHQVLGISDIDGTSNNLMPNSSFEDGEPTSTASGWDENGTISNEYAYRGNQSMRVASHGLYDNVATYGPTYTIEPGETYTFSAYVFTATPDQRVQLLIDLRPLSGTNYTKIYMDEPGWRRVQVSYTNEGTSAETIYTRIDVVNGTVYVDGIQVEKTGAASPYNEVANGDFLSNGHTSGSWVDKDGNASSGYHFDDNSAPNLMLSSGAVKIEGDPTAEKYLEQYIPVSGGAGDAFVLSGWAKANALPVTDSRQFGLKLIFHNRDNTETVFHSSFDPDIGVENWQYTALTAVADKLYTFITVQLIYNYQANTVLFDGIQLTEGRAGNTYTYDENKNVVEETNILGQITKYEYHDNGVDLKKIEPSVGSIVHYEEYDAYHNVIKMNETISDESGTDHTITYEYTYDDYGNVTSVTVTQGTLRMKSVTAYTSDGNYIKATTDGIGKTTRYGYHLQTGVLKWVQYPEDTPGTADTEDAEGTEGTESTEYVAGTTDTRTYYVYDEMFRLIETYVTTDKNDTMYAQYEYENELLKELWTQSTVYRFTYNYYNLRTSVSVGDRQLATYSYNSKHYLTQLDFANGDSVKYSYDSLGRVTKEEYYEDGDMTTIARTIRYYYDYGGALARMKDSETGIETWCVYDYAGRVGIFAEARGDTYREIVYTYDENGNITKIDETVDEHYLLRGEPFSDRNIYGYEYFYDYKNRLETVTTHDGQKNYHYDDLDRLTGETVKTSDGTEVLSANYNYKNAIVGGTYVTTNQVYSKIVNAAYYQQNFIYGYDDNGNIISVGDGTYTITYEYDSANQLIRENNPYENRTWVWTYDAAGNITSKKEYTYTTVATEALGNPIDSFAYTYSNADWGDLLTAYDGLVIQYDEIGNPLSDGKWEYTWQQGRQLATMSDGETTWTYTYDVNGMRLSRSTGTGADDVTYTYVYTDGLLTRMTKGDIMLFFTYDAAGTPLTVSIHTGTNCKVKKGQACGADCETFYYVTNLQGDVIAILDENGNEVAEYSYDAWGRLLCDLDEDEETIYSLNPLLYRGYVYDRETGLYYLQSRYYNPEIGRFISADVYASTGQGILGNNMFAYCNNNPVNYSDPSGHFSILAFAIAIGVSLAFELLDDAMDGEIFEGSHDWKDYLGAGIAGALGGLGGGFAVQAMGSLAGGFIDAALSGDLETNGFWGTLDGIMFSSVISFGVGAASNRLAAGMKASSLRKLTNNAANRELKKMGAKIKIGSHAAKAPGGLSYAIREQSKWIGNVIFGDLVGSVSGGLTSIGHGHVMDALWWPYKTDGRIIV